MPVAFLLQELPVSMCCSYKKRCLCKKNVVRAKVFVNRYSVVYH